jgi:LEA14-like dessication related protein
MELLQGHRNHRPILQALRRCAIGCQLIVLLVFATGCFTYQDVELEQMQDVKIEKFSNDEIRLRVVASVSNPNSYNIKIKKASFDLYSGEKFIGHATLDEKIVLKKNTTGTYEALVITNLKESKGGLMTLAGQALLKGEVEIRAKGVVKAGAFGLSKKFKVDEKKKFPMSGDMMKSLGG